MSVGDREVGLSHFTVDAEPAALDCASWPDSPYSTGPSDPGARGAFVVDFELVRALREK